MIEHFVTWFVSFVTLSVALTFSIVAAITIAFKLTMWAYEYANKITNGRVGEILHEGDDEDA